MPRYTYNEIKQKMIYFGIFIILFVIITLYYFPNYYYYYNTSFNRNIVVKDKYISQTYDEENGSKTLYYIVTTDNTTYEIVNIWWKLDFNNADDYARFDIGKSYHVKGYGFRIPYFNMFPKIYDFVD